MKAYCVIAAVAVSLGGAVGTAWAQPYYGGRDYDRRDRDYDYRDRGYDRRDRDYDDRDRGYRGQVGFDEREYLRCNPDVARAVRNGQVPSGAAHYKVFGRKENRRLSC